MIIFISIFLENKSTHSNYYFLRRRANLLIYCWYLPQLFHLELCILFFVFIYNVCFLNFFSFLTSFCTLDLFIFFSMLLNISSEYIFFTFHLLSVRSRLSLQIYIYLGFAFFNNYFIIKGLIYDYNIFLPKPKFIFAHSLAPKDLCGKLKLSIINSCFLYYLYTSPYIFVLYYDKYL